MQKTISSLAFTAILVMLLAPVAEARVYTYWENIDEVASGVHPWEGRRRPMIANHERARPPYWTDNYFYEHPDYSQTHALHPYYRERYYEPPVNVDEYRYNRAYDSDNRFQAMNAYLPEPANISTCENYSYARPSYRVPPYDYDCTR